MNARDGRVAAARRELEAALAASVREERTSPESSRYLAQAESARRQHEGVLAELRESGADVIEHSATDASVLVHHVNYGCPFVRCSWSVEVPNVWIGRGQLATHVRDRHNVRVDEGVAT